MEQTQTQPQPHSHEHHSHQHHHDHQHSHTHEHAHAHSHPGSSEKEIWNGFAAHYGENIEKGSLPVGITLSRMAKIESAKSIVEVGCSTGVLSLHWLTLLPSDVKYTSVDISEEMIKYAKYRKEQAGDKYRKNDHTFIQGDAQDLSFIPNESADVYVSSLMMCHVPDPVKAFREALRVVKPGGRIAVSTSTSGKNTMDELMKEAAAKGGIQPQMAHAHGLRSKEDLIRIAQEAGVEIEYCWEQDLPWEIFEEEELRKMLNSRFPAGKDLSEEARGSFINQVIERFGEKKKNWIPLVVNVAFLVGKKPKQ